MQCKASKDYGELEQQELFDQNLTKVYLIEVMGLVLYKVMSLPFVQYYTEQYSKASTFLEW